MTRLEVCCCSLTHFPQHFLVNFTTEQTQTSLKSVFEKSGGRVYRVLTFKILLFVLWQLTAPHAARPRKCSTYAIPHFTGQRFHYDGKIGPDCREAPWIAVRTVYEQRERSRSASKHHERLRTVLLLTLLKTSAEQRRSERKWRETPRQRSRKSIVVAAA